ncbi:MAG: hypothetical protein DI536_07760 [Archangium gephyra]|uniref:GmrSD restriction endonucleases N-terminal domain-containing protein n=1 Tax=Archangium gephyra TaxID=48 RepID=A0A2W5TKY1_9BACT|nr:MAG: hypothetical protein DI536_07760 [Archangium gephyra]
MGLSQEIEKWRKEIQSDRLSMSIGELEGIYERNEINIHPKFQRVLRWTTSQKSKLIESILLRIPLPPIFVAQDSNGTWDVVDGAQRLGTIFEFLGILKDERGLVRPPLALEESTLLPSLAGCSFDTGETKFPLPERLDFRRSRLEAISELAA